MITILICTLKKELELNNELPTIIVSPNKYENKDNIKWVKDYGMGMAAARNAGLKAVKTEYVLYLGDDNTLNDVFIKKAIEYINANRWVGCGFLTRFYLPEGYNELCLDKRYKYRFKEGNASVIGSPFLFRTEVLKRFMFDDKCGYCDDTDLCDRMKFYGHQFGFSKYICYESKERAAEVKERFIMYGKGDKSYYEKYSPNWSIFRKLQSILHPLMCEFIPSIFYIPFYFYIVFWRYYGWIKSK